MCTTFSNLIEEKIKHLYEYVSSIVPDEKKDELTNIVDQPLSAKMLFILFLRRDKVDEHVAEFCNTFGINEDQHKAKITEYINFFLDVKEQLFTQYTQSPSACLQ